MNILQRRTLGVLALGGGAVGFAAGIALLLSRTNPLEWAFCIAFCTLYAWGIWCGIRLLEGKPGAERANLKFWLVQIPSFGSPKDGICTSQNFRFARSEIGRAHV